MTNAMAFNAPNWADLSTPDVDASIEFYRELLGWDIATEVTEMGAYHLATIDGRQVCGLMKQPVEMKGAPAGWTVFFNVADVDVMIESIGAAGGRILEPAFLIPGGARVCVASDPNGAMFALICGGPLATGTWYSAASGSVCWVEVMTREPETAMAFYEEVFGWDARTDEGGYTTFLCNGEMIAGLLHMPDDVPPEAPAHWSVYFAVDRCELTERAAVDLGGSVLVEARPVETGHFAVLEDPAGAVFDIMDFSIEPAKV